MVSRAAGTVLGVLMALGRPAAVAAPADDHAAALGAYRRGDVVAAMAALRPAAAAGHAPSQALLGFILERADVVDEAVPLYRRAAAQDDAEAHAALGQLSLSGRGLAKDEKQAMWHFSKAADLGHATAIRIVADGHLSGAAGLGRSEGDPAAARIALQRAAAIDHLPAIDALARAHRDGRFGLGVDAAQAAAWEARAAEVRRQRGARPAGARSTP